MAKLTLSDIASLQNETSAIATLNDNNDTLETALENTLSRDGTSPNTMSANLDMNSNRILNLPAPSNDSEPLRFGDIDQITGISGTIVAPGSSTNNGVVKWTGTTASTIASSGVTIDSSDNLAVPGTSALTGHVGIGAASSSSAKLYITGTGTSTDASKLILGETSVREWRLGAGSEVSGKFSIVNGSSGLAPITIDSASLIGINTTAPSGELEVYNATSANQTRFIVRGASSTFHVTTDGVGTNVGTSNATRLGLDTNGSTRIYISSAGDVGIANTSPATKLDVTGTVNISSTATIGGQLNVATGTTAIAPVKLTAGTNLTTAASGALEFDGVNFYSTIDTTSGRGIMPSEQYFHLTADGSAITTIANFFGATSNISLAASAYYEIEIHLWFLKTTANTVVWTLTNSAAPTSQNIVYEMSPVGALVAPPGTATLLVGHTEKDSSAAFTITTGSLTDATEHYARIRIWLQNGAGTSLKIQGTATTGSITPRLGSYWVARRRPAGNVGTFAA